MAREDCGLLLFALYRYCIEELLFENKRILTPDEAQVGKNLQ